MNLTRRLPFQNLQARNWLNLTMACVLALYVFYIAWEILLGRMCSQIGVDYCDFWSAGRAATTHGYAAVYDLQVLGQIQRSLLPVDVDPSRIAVVPFPYLPVFVLPFQPLSLLDPGTGFGLWTLLNLVGFLLYLRFFARRVAPKRALSPRVMLLILTALPTFLTIFTGQASVWLVICIGEFMRALMDGHQLRGGLWLGGLLLKPQTLILIVPIFLLHKSFRVLAGLAICALAIGLVSMALIGPHGLYGVVGIWGVYAGGGASNWIEGMMNWRMLGLHLSAFTPPLFAWGIAALGILITVSITIYMWRRPFDARTAAFALPVLGILASTTMVAWHSHVHMAMILIPPLIVLHQAGALPEKVMHYWVFVPAALFLLVVFGPPALQRLGIVSDPGASLFYLFIGGGQFAVNLYLFWWALRTSPRMA